MPKLNLKLNKLAEQENEYQANKRQSQSLGTLILPHSQAISLLIDCLYSMQKQEGKAFQDFIKFDVIRWRVLPSQYNSPTSF